EAFRATLEEVENADIILHVRDIAHPDTGAQKDDVLKVLGSLNIGPDDPRLIEVLNKIDMLNDDKRDEITEYAARMEKESIRSWSFPPGKPTLKEGVKGGSVAISALSGLGTDRLLHLLEERLKLGEETRDLKLGYEEGAKLAWLYDHGEITKRE